MKGVSVVICTYNGKGRLQPTLEHIIGQQVSRNLRWEVIVVDNNSSDGTGQWCTEFLERTANAKVEWRVIQEKVPGLSHARKAGVQGAGYDYVIFCDDDNWLCPGYVEEVHIFLDENKEVGVLGGMGIPVFESKKPDWFDPRQRTYAVGPQGEDQMGEGVFYGASVAIRKSVLVKLFEDGFESLLSDRKGNDLVSGGDNELFLWYRMAGYKLYNRRSLVFHHFIPNERLSKQYLIRRAEAKGQTEAILSAYVSWVEDGKPISWMDSKSQYYISALLLLVRALLIRMLRRADFNRILFFKTLYASALYRFRNYDLIKMAGKRIAEMMTKTIILNSERNRMNNIGS
jgi:glycosyltransferase involved in cell wall biosynthesis